MKINKKAAIISLIAIIIVVIVCLIIGVYVYINKRDYEIEKIDKWNYFIYVKDGKMGVINNSGDIIINPEYKYIKIPNPTKDVFICTKEDNQILVINENKQQIFYEYEEVEPFELKELAIDIPYEKTVLKYKKDNKYGIINYEGKKITNAIYNSISNLPYKEGELLVQKDGKYGVINILGNKVIDVIYDEINIDNYYEEEILYKNSGYIVGTKEGDNIKYGYINNNKQKVLDTEYDSIKRIIDIKNVDDIYLICEKDNKFGVNKNNQTLINIEYSNIEFDNLNKLFITQKDNKYGVINFEGNVIVSNLYDSVDIEGMYIYAQKNNEEFIFDNNGKNIEDSEYTSKYQIDNTEYKITINKNNKYGVINNKDEVIIPNIYNYIGYLTNNYFVVSTENGKNGIVNDKGEIILETKYDTIQKLDNCDLIEVNIIDTNTVSLYNKNIEKILQMNNATIKEYSEYVKIYSKDELKYINFNGEEKSSKEILPDNNLYIDVKNGKWGFIDKQGNVIVDYLYDEVTEFNQYGFAGIKKDEKWGSIDKTGKIIIEPKYKINISSNEIDFIGQYYRIIYGYKKFYYTNNVNE